MVCHVCALLACSLVSKSNHFHQIPSCSRLELRHLLYQRVLRIIIMLQRRSLLVTKVNLVPMALEKPRVPCQDRVASISCRQVKLRPLHWKNPTSGYLLNSLRRQIQMAKERYNHLLCDLFLFELILEYRRLPPLEPLTGQQTKMMEVSGQFQLTDRAM